MMIFDPDSSILVIFCRRPAPGVGKQRIAAELGESAAYEAATLLLDATLEDARGWSGPVVIAPATAKDSAWAAELLPGAVVIAQGCGNLGTRIRDVQAQIRDQGGRHIIFIGSDSPGLTPQLIRSAFEQLERTDTVFMPARDGGVTLMGSRLPWPELSGLPWESRNLGVALQECCRKAGMTAGEMEAGYDIDTRQDLVDAVDLLAADPRPARVKLRTWILATGVVPDKRTTREPLLSAIIPVFDDQPALASLLQCLANLQPGIDDVVVVDGNNSEGCRRLCSDFAARYFATLPNRGAQLRQGAANATGDILWFLHADSFPCPDSVTQIRRHIAAGNNSGYFRFHFDGAPRWHKRWLETAINLRARIGTPYGDQGLFVDREAYERAGGHTATPLFEEVRLIKQLRREHGCTPVAASIGVSSRRWERDGWLRRSLHNRYLAAAFALGIAPGTTCATIWS